MLVFIGFALFLLLRWTQVLLSKGVDQHFYHRWWMALVAALVGVSIITLSGPSATPTIILNQPHDGALEGADYWRDEPLILSAGMGFDNIIGVQELTEDTVREAGGSWYGSLTCTNGEELILYISGGLHALADGLAGFTEFISAEFFVIDSGDFDVDVDTV